MKVCLFRPVALLEISSKWKSIPTHFVDPITLKSDYQLRRILNIPKKKKKEDCIMDEFHGAVKLANRGSIVERKERRKVKFSLG